MLLVDNELEKGTDPLPRPRDELGNIGTGRHGVRDHAPALDVGEAQLECVLEPLGNPLPVGVVGEPDLPRHFEEQSLVVGELASGL